MVQYEGSKPAHENRRLQRSKLKINANKTLIENLIR